MQELPNGNIPISSSAISQDEMSEIIKSMAKALPRGCKRLGNNCKVYNKTAARKAAKVARRARATTRRNKK